MRLLTATATSLTLLLSTACFAADRYQVRAPSFGCVLTWTTWAVNDQRNPRRHDYRWLRHVIDRGQCRMVSPNQQWEQIGRTNGLLLLQPVPSQAGVSSLFFRPTDLQRSTGPLVPVPLPVPVAPSVLSQDLAPPSPQPAAHDPVPETAPPPVEAPVAAAEPSTPEPSLPAPSGSLPAATAPVTTPADTETAPPVLSTAEPPMAASPAPIDAAPVASPTPVNTAPVMSPAAFLASTGAALVAGLIAALIVLAGLITVAVRRRSRRRLGMRRQERLPMVRSRMARSPMERLDAHPVATAVPDPDLVSPPPIDTLDYRQRCMKSLGEAGWQARMSFPAGGLTADIIARRDGRTLTMQCRPSTQPLESVVVQEALIVRRAQDANLAAVVSNAGYTKAARSFAAASGVRLLHETELPEFTG